MASMSSKGNGNDDLRLRRLKVMGMSDDEDDCEDEGNSKTQNNTTSNTATASSPGVSTNLRSSGKAHNSAQSQNPIMRLQSASGNTSPARGVARQHSSPFRRQPSYEMSGGDAHLQAGSNLSPQAMTSSMNSLTRQFDAKLHEMTQLTKCISRCIEVVDSNDEEDQAFRSTLTDSIIAKHTQTDISNFATFFMEMGDKYAKMKQSAEEIVAQFEDDDGNTQSLELMVSNVNTSELAHSDYQDTESVFEFGFGAALVFGSINVDLVAQVNEFPKPNTNQPGYRFETMAGGKGANEAVACGRLGVTTFMIACIGEDDFGKIMLGKLAKDCIVDGIRKTNKAGTGVAMILNAKDKSKSTTTCAAANDKVGKPEVEMAREYLRQQSNIRVVLVQLEVNLRAVVDVIQIAYEQRKLVVLRAAPVALGTEQRFPTAVWNDIDMIIANEIESPIILSDDGRRESIDSLASKVESGGISSGDTLSPDATGNEDSGHADESCVDVTEDMIGSDQGMSTVDAEDVAENSGRDAISSEASNTRESEEQKPTKRKGSKIGKWMKGKLSKGLSGSKQKTKGVSTDGTAAHHDASNPTPSGQDAHSGAPEPKVSVSSDPSVKMSEQDAPQMLPAKGSTKVPDDELKQEPSEGDEFHEYGTDLPAVLQNLQQCCQAAKELMDKSRSLIIVIIPTGFGVMCRINVDRARRRHPYLLGAEESAIAAAKSARASMVSTAESTDLKDERDVQVADENNTPSNPSDPPGRTCGLNARTSSTVSSEKEDEISTIILPSFYGKVVDVIGAVDAITGGVTAAIAHGIPLYHALIWATAAVARSLSAPGAQSAMPSLDELEAFLVERNVHVRMPGARTVDAALLWPETQPEVPAEVRHLEELLNMERLQFPDRLQSVLMQEQLTVDKLALPVDFQGQTLLHLAVVHNDLMCVAALLRSIDVFLAFDRYGMSPLDRCHEQFKISRGARKKDYALMKMCMLTTHKVLTYVDELEQGAEVPSERKVLTFNSAMRSQSERASHVLRRSNSGGCGEDSGRLYFDTSAHGPFRYQLHTLHDCGDTFGSNMLWGLPWQECLLMMMFAFPNDTISLPTPKAGAWPSAPECASMQELATSLLQRVRRATDAYAARKQAVPQFHASPLHHHRLHAPIYDDAALLRTVRGTRLVGGVTFAHGIAFCGHKELLQWVVEGDETDTVAASSAGSRFSTPVEQAVPRSVTTDTLNGVAGRVSALASDASFDVVRSYSSADGFTDDDNVLGEEYEASARAGPGLGALGGLGGLDEVTETDTMEDANPRSRTSSGAGDATQRRDKAQSKWDSAGKKVTAAVNATSKWVWMTDVSKRTVLHFAAAAQSDKVCKYLIRGGFDLYTRDGNSCTPLDYVSDETFSADLERFGATQDTFVSLGHSDEVDGFVADMVAILNKKKLRVWWDKGGVRQRGEPRGARATDQGIDAGMVWTLAIERNIKKAKTFLVILTKKWLKSKFCQAEARLALMHQKEFFVVYPPVSAEEQATIDDVRNNALVGKAMEEGSRLVRNAVTDVGESNIGESVYSTMQRRQTFDFSNLKLTMDGFGEAIGEVVDSIQEFLNLKAQGEAMGKEPVLDVSQTQPVSDVIQPSNGVSHMQKPTDFVLVLSGVDVADVKGKSFSQLIKQSMLAQGFPVCAAYAHSKHNTTDGANTEDDVLLTARVKACALMIIVIEAGANEKFVETYVQIASSNGTECVVVPYCKMKEMGEGLSYALSTIGNHNSWCFTDWVGTSTGLQESSPHYQDMFKGFVKQLQDIIHPQKSLQTTAHDTPLSTPSMFSTPKTLTPSVSTVAELDATPNTGSKRQVSVLRTPTSATTTPGSATRNRRSTML
eukprot:m.48952 g.48952  ORF g.48952 m.48952 type:complete len:1849 (+) comp15285_c0_seq2:486-6032(+)